MSKALMMVSKFLLKQCNFPKERFVPPPAELEHSVIDNSLDDESNQLMVL